jgi:hypothetical protein
MSKGLLESCESTLKAIANAVRRPTHGLDRQEHKWLGILSDLRDSGRETFYDYVS